MAKRKYKSKGKSICKDCAFRFRRCFIPMKLEDYVDEDGNALFSDNDNIVVLNMCLISNMDIDNEITIDCNHYKNKYELEKENPDFYKYLNTFLNNLKNISDTKKE